MHWQQWESWFWTPFMHGYLFGSKNISPHGSIVLQSIARPILYERTYAITGQTIYMYVLCT